MFEELGDASFLKREREILAFWEKERIFLQSIEQRKRARAPLFSFYDGPPFATGLPHYGHLLAGTIKDVVLRYRTMRGWHVPRPFGWDCHGLPVEHEVEKSHGIRSEAVENGEIDIASYNQLCSSVVLRYAEQWKKTIERMGRWVDFSQTYRTMDCSFMESVWWLFGQLYERGLIYEGYKVMPFSPQLGTPLSNFEAGENYREVEDPAIVVAFSLLDRPDHFLLAWTTTPWTLPSNLALAVGKEIVYQKVYDAEKRCYYILSQTALSRFDAERRWEREGELMGEQLLGASYCPLFPYFAAQRKRGAFRVIFSDHVNTQEGTGIVHMAPAFGEEDFLACQREGITPVCPVDERGRFTEEIAEYAGRFVKECDHALIDRLRKEGKLISCQRICHRYPHCYRSDAPLIYRAMNSWFLRVTDLRESLLQAVEKIHWVPNHVKEGRFGKWLEQARDWAISRNRYWGTPLPVWRSEEGKLHIITSVRELEELSGKSPLLDLHRHHVDSLTFYKEGQLFRRVREVLDCWFESGAMPYAQLHYPFANRKLFESSFPADFIAEGLDQTRGWFYTLNVLSTALFSQAAFKHVVVNGILLAEDGNKMSKRLKNYPQPEKMLEKYGADAIRFYLLQSGAVRGEDLRFVPSGVELTLKQFFFPLWNVYKGFFLTYARLYRWQPVHSSLHTFHPIASLDRWILSLSQQLIQRVQEQMDQYQLLTSVTPLVHFIQQLANWYIRRSRRRFWDEDEASCLDRGEAFHTLYFVLLNVSKLLAPFAPFFAEILYRNMRGKEDPLSVHLCDFPILHSELRDLSLEARMQLVQRVVSLGHALRKRNGWKVRQPLSSITVLTSDPEQMQLLKGEEESRLICEELNVKQLFFSSQEEKFLQIRAKPNFPLLGKRVGKRMPQVQREITKWRKEQIETLLARGFILLTCSDGEELTLQREEVIIERKVRSDITLALESDGQLSVLLNGQLTPELRREGLAREWIHKINSERKACGLQIDDRIQLWVDCDQEAEQMWHEHGEEIAQETLTLEYHLCSFSKGEGGISSCEIEGKIINLKMKKVEKTT